MLERMISFTCKLDYLTPRHGFALFGSRSCLHFGVSADVSLTGSGSMHFDSSSLAGLRRRTSVGVIWGP